MEGYFRFQWEWGCFSDGRGGVPWEGIGFDGGGGGSKKIVGWPPLPHYGKP